MNEIPYARQQLDEEDLRQVMEVLKSDWITQGPKVAEFEVRLAAYVGARYAVAVSNGTAALHLACIAAGLKAGDEAITSPITFLATSNAVIYTGATPVFADVNYETANIDPNKIQKRITKRSKAILPVHFAGLPCNLKEVASIAKRHGLAVIEDACHALGSKFVGKKIGSCQFSDMTVFSFHPVKHITTGEGGCITTNSHTLYKKLCALRSHGVYRSNSLAKSKGGWYGEMQDLGFNYRITDFQCALGISQLSKIDRFLERRREIARRYQQSLNPFQDYLKLPELEYQDRSHAWHLYILRLKLKKNSLTRLDLYNQLKTRGVKAQVHYRPVYQNTFYQKFFSNQRVVCPNAEQYYQECISLPMFPALTNEEIKIVCKSIEEIVYPSCKAKPSTKKRVLTSKKPIASAQS